MRKVLRSTVLIFGGIVFGSVVGFVIGIHSLAVTEAAPRGALSLMTLGLLNDGKIDRAQLMLEYEVDHSLSLYSQVDTAWWEVLYDAGLLIRDREADEAYIRRIALYRKSHPGPFSTVQRAESELLPEEQKLLENQRELIEMMVEKYGGD